MTRIKIILLLSFHFSIAFSQLDTIIEPNTKTIYPRRECIYEHISPGQDTVKKCKYWVGKKRVTKEVYEEHSKYLTPIERCHPCYLISKVQNKIIFEGEFYQDCGIGKYIERYSNGKIKVKGQHKEPSDKNYETLRSTGKCTLRTGEWFYYNEKGELEKTVIYKDNVEVKN